MNNHKAKHKKSLSTVHFNTELTTRDVHSVTELSRYGYLVLEKLSRDR